MIRSLPRQSHTRALVARRLLTAAATLGVALTTSCAADASALAGAITGGKRASGRVSLAVSVDASRTQPFVGTTETKRELAQTDLAFDLGEVQGVGGALFKWDNTQYGGTASAFEEYTRPGTVPIPGTRDSRNCTTVDSTSQSFSSAGAGGQPGDVKLEIQGNSYQLYIDAGGTGPTNVTQVTNTNCTTDGRFARSTNSFTYNLVPFSQYFSSYTNGAAGTRISVSGTIPAGSNRVNDVLQWTDSMVVFSVGTTTLKVPVFARLTWDITLK